MAPIDGPYDYHRYPPRGGRKPARGQGSARPARSARNAAGDTPDKTSGIDPTDNMYDTAPTNRVSGRTRRPSNHRMRPEEFEAPHTHVRFDPADLPDRHTPPQQRPKGKHQRRKPRDRSVPLSKIWIKRARFCAVVLMIVGVGELAAAALTAKDFRVHEVEVSGLNVTSPTLVRPLAEELVGQNWIRANTKATVKQVRALPAVRSAHVERTLDWPPKLALRIEERTPFARVGAGSEWWVVDEAGVPFRRARKEDEKLYAVTSKDFKPRPGVALNRKKWEPVVAFACALSQDGGKKGTGASHWELRRIYFDKDGFASLRLEGGAHDELLVRLGAGRWPEKLKRAHQALAWFEKTGSRASELNLVSYNMPVWTPRMPSAATATDGASATGTEPAERAVGPQRPVDDELPEGAPSTTKPSIGREQPDQTDEGRSDL